MTIRVIAPTTGISDEDRAMIQFLRDSGVDCRITCTTNHSELSLAGYRSRHVWQGTNGKGLGIDSTGPRKSIEPDAHLEVFNAFLKVEKQLHELIYAYAPFNIRDGKRVKPYAVLSHKDHVHTSVDKGTFIKWPYQLPTIPHDEDDEMKPRLVRAPDGSVWAFDGVALRSANNVHYQNVVRWYSGQTDNWDNWNQDQINAFPKDPGAPES